MNNRMPVLVSWIIESLVLLVVSNIVPGFSITSFYTSLAVVAILAVVNAFIRPLLLLLTLPINLISLGLFTFVINAGMLLLVSDIVKGFTIDGFAPAFYAALLISLINMIIDKITRKPVQY